MRTLYSFVILSLIWLVGSFVLFSYLHARLDSFWSAVVVQLILWSVVSRLLLTFVHIPIKRLAPTYPNSKFNRQPFVACGHRGAAGEHSENTLRSFEKAVQCGMQLLELDVHLTKDKHVVVVHDRNLQRLCGENVDVNRTNFADLPPLLPRHRLQLPPPFNDIDQVHLCTEDQSRDELEIPLLESIFRRFPAHAVNLDVKASNDRAVVAELIDKVRQLIKTYKRERLTTWGSFHPWISRDLARHQNIPQFSDFETVILAYLAYWIGFLPFLSLNYAVFQVPMLTPSLIRRIVQYYVQKNHRRSTSTPITGAMLQVKVAFASAILNLAKAIANRQSFVEHIKKRGSSVAVWVINEEADFDAAKQLGVDVVITDFPTKLEKYLSSSSLRR